MTGSDRAPELPWAPGWVYLSAGEEPIECELRETPEDFEVEELAAYEPSGEGTHVYLWIEKRGLTTRDAIQRLAHALGRERGAFGAAGRKDKHALTRQWISVEGVEPEAALALELEGLSVLRAERHPHKLRPGKLRGNRFRIRLRGVAPADRPRLARVLALVEARGMPNAFGAQRFGRAGTSFELGRMLLERRWRDYVLALATPPQAEEGPDLAALHAALEGEQRGALRAFGREPRRIGRELAAAARQLARRPGDWRGAVRALDRDLTELHLSALQARVFNRVLARRLAEQGSLGFDRLERGDLAYLHDRGAVFLVEDPSELEPRRAHFELSPSGPIPGFRMTRAQGAPGLVEEEALAAEGVSLESFRALGIGLDPRGARRPLRVRPEGLALAWEGDDALLSFALPKGSYATALLAEVRKRG